MLASERTSTSLTSCFVEAGLAWVLRPASKHLSTGGPPCAARSAPFRCCAPLSRWNVCASREHGISMALKQLGSFPHGADTHRTERAAHFVGCDALVVLPGWPSAIAPPGGHCASAMRGGTRTSAPGGHPSGGPASRCRGLVGSTPVEQAHGLHSLGVTDQHPPLGDQARHRSEAMAPKNSALFNGG